MKYIQKTGEIFDIKGNLLGTGYSGHGIGKNNPEMQDVKNVGPIPKGRYQIGEKYDSKHTGPFTIILIPDPKNNMFGRSGFRIHGDSIVAPGTASEGCIILSRNIREIIYENKGKYILVV